MQSKHRKISCLALLVSTVQRILLDATCPVLAVRTDKL
jgi:nucleotide-binding universal stress UspA family protein